VWYCLILCGTALCCVALPYTVWHCLILLYCVVLPCAVWYCLIPNTYTDVVGISPSLGPATLKSMCQRDSSCFCHKHLRRQCRYYPFTEMCNSETNVSSVTPVAFVTNRVTRGWALTFPLQCWTWLWRERCEKPVVNAVCACVCVCVCWEHVCVLCVVICVVKCVL
jgi:hypothetical protein